MKVLFHEPTEFLEEVRRHPPDLEPVVRLTQRFTTSTMSPHIRQVAICATYLRQLSAARIILVELDHYCGEHWSGAPGPSQAMDEACAIIDQLTKQCGELKLEVRAGLYHEEPYDKR